MDSRNWADLSSDCLITIFSKVGDTRSLSQSLQFVSKSWFRASLDPRCWETLSFSGFCSLNLLKFAVDRSQECATTVIFGFDFPWEGLRYLADGCPLLKVLVFEQQPFGMDRADQQLLCYGLSKWKNLEKFQLQSCQFLIDLVETIGVDCKKFVELNCSGTYCDEGEVEAIVRCLPQLKSLNMSGSSLNRHQIVEILTTCKDLEYFDVSFCWGFVPDNEIHRLASHIKVFNCKGCKRNQYDFNCKLGYKEIKIEDYGYDGYSYGEYDHYEDYDYAGYDFREFDY